MTDGEVLQILRQTGALRQGHFLLRSGLHSERYVQCAQLLQYPRIAERLCAALAARLAGSGAAAVISPAMGGILVGHEVARTLGLRHIFAEKIEAGRLALRRDFEIAAGERFLVVEDVITRGGRVRETLEIVRGRGGEPVAVGSLVDRSAGAVDFGIRLESLLKLSVETYEPSVCPICRAGGSPVKPGS
jgi:orotate phosphoribosyltransferase